MLGRRSAPSPGVETQRQWSDQAIACTNPARLGLFSLVTLWANDSAAAAAIKPRAALWYPPKPRTLSSPLIHAVCFPA